MGKGFDKLKTFGSLKELESATGERFEMYAQVMLSLIHSNYIGTRIHKDDGIDGILLLRECGSGDPRIYSIYGPEKGTGWNSKFPKIKYDIARIKEFTEGKFKDYTICFVFNFKPAGEELIELNNYCNSEGVKYVFLYPDKLFNELEGSTKLINAIAFLDGIDDEGRELTDWNNHIFAGKVLEILCQINESDDDIVDKLQTILILKYKLLSYLPSKVVKLTTDFKNTVFVLPKKKLFKEMTTVNQGCRTVYIYDKKKRKINQFSEESYKNISGKKLELTPTLFKLEQGLFAIKIEDLYVIFFLLNQCYAQLENKGKFSLSKALWFAEYFENAELIRKAK
ncbi:hypothetical protein [Lysinibacillus fusiformis]|uniref:hypothetical protein n=1 Tax=Lysinibacillus fusiformis TaxID=28031 RepID=UPI001880F34B|nr:hypothetical protein [Lysinibacillus fusiformis]MBD8523823.1 hypothetical protein [Lysinibacillus fusiformis]